MSWKRLQNKNLQNRLRQRAKIISLAREFFISKGFLEIETPILVPFAGQEPYLNPIKVQLANGQGYLITSPEYAHKKLLAAGFKKTFEITKCFRDGEPSSGLHNPEFTMLEWYRARADYSMIMQDVEKMTQYVMRGLLQKRRENFQFPISNFQKNFKLQTLELKYQDNIINFSSPWERITVHEAFEKYVGVSNRAKIYDHKFLRSLCMARGYTVNKADSYEDLFFKIFLTEIEPKLGFKKPTILYQYPAQMASLARLVSKRRANHLAERFELYIAGIELANAFSELNNGREQRQRFLQEQKLRKKLKKKIIPLDEDFLDAVNHMPLAAGIALGIDRLVMLFTNAKTIKEVLAFPVIVRGQTPHNVQPNKHNVIRK